MNLLFMLVLVLTPFVSPDDAPNTVIAVDIPATTGRLTIVSTPPLVDFDGDAHCAGDGAIVTCDLTGTAGRVLLVVPPSADVGLYLQTPHGDALATWQRRVVLPLVLP